MCNYKGIAFHINYMQTCVIDAWFYTCICDVWSIKASNKRITPNAAK